jgi:hypothetical protein
MNRNRLATMTDPDTPDAPPARATSQVNAGRAVAVIVVFLVAMVLLLGPAGRADRHAAPTVASTTTTTLYERPVVPSATRVQVANGTTVAGQAAAYSHTLQTRGWDVVPPVQGPPWDRSLVFYAPTYEPAAKQIAGELGLAADRVVSGVAVSGVTGAAGNDIVVVIGPDLAHS